MVKTFYKIWRGLPKFSKNFCLGWANKCQFVCVLVIICSRVLVLFCVMMILTFANLFTIYSFYLKTSFAKAYINWKYNSELRISSILCFRSKVYPSTLLMHNFFLPLMSSQSWNLFPYNRRSTQTKTDISLLSTVPTVQSKKCGSFNQPGDGQVAVRMDAASLQQPERPPCNIDSTFLHRNNYLNKVLYSKENQEKIYLCF